MKQRTIKFSFRGKAADIERIDRIADQYGFKTRSKFLLHAGLSFEVRSGDDDIMSELARIVYSIRQIERAVAGLPFLLKPADVTYIRREVRRTMVQILERTS
jgi:hypothetical protein